MPPYNTPGVYVEEIPTLPPSVAETSTAVPAFIGHTDKGPPIARVTTLLEYTQTFGGPDLAKFTVTSNDGELRVERKAAAGGEYRLYYAISHYFKNGGAQRPYP